MLSAGDQPSEIRLPVIGIFSTRGSDDQIWNAASMSGLNFGGLTALFAVAALAGCFDAIAGGGGLLTIPALLLAGLDPVSAIATNKLQGAAATLSATAAFARRRLIDWHTAVPIAATAGLGSVVAAFC